MMMTLVVEKLVSRLYYANLDYYHESYNLHSDNCVFIVACWILFQF